jgi:glycine cleavage system regulatory protein
LPELVAERTRYFVQTLLVMTVIGQDRPGLVESVADLVASHGGNWLESRMSRLGGQFAGILRVEVSAEKEGELVANLKALSSRGLTVVVHSDRPEVESPVGRVRILEIVGQDRPGIVRQISHALASHGVNVEELQTECASAAMTGEALFKARAKLRVPDSADVEKIRQNLEKIASDLIVDISFAGLDAEEPISKT